MRFQIVIEGETDDVELNNAGGIRSQTKVDVIKMLETTLPYMLDNVMVTSKLIEEKK